MRICIVKLRGATIHKHWTNTNSIITSAAINENNISGLNLTKQQKKTYERKANFENVQEQKY